MRELKVKLAKNDHQPVIDKWDYKLHNSMEPPGYDPNGKLIRGQLTFVSVIND